MNLNQYTDKIIKILKETPADNQYTIWEVFVNDKEIRNGGVFSEVNIELMDAVFLTDIRKIKKKGWPSIFGSTLKIAIFMRYQHPSWKIHPNMKVILFWI